MKVCHLNGSAGIREAQCLGAGHGEEVTHILRDPVLDQGKAL